MQSSESEARAMALKSSQGSVMHACESLAAGAGRKRDLRDYVRVDQGRRPARCDLLTVATNLRIKCAGPSVEPHLVFCGWIKRFLKRAVRIGGGKLDRAIRGTDFDVEGAGTRDDVCR